MRRPSRRSPAGAEKFQPLESPRYLVRIGDPIQSQSGEGELVVGRETQLILLVSIKRP
jgi:hypothetical protein